MANKLFKDLDDHVLKNNIDHHTVEISRDKLCVRRGQHFNVSVDLTKAFNPSVHSLGIIARTGESPSEEDGTLSFFSIPDAKNRSPKAKAVWKVELHKQSSPQKGKLILSITPPADAPIGAYRLTLKLRDEERLLRLVVLFNPWCPEDSVYLKDDSERDEYVLNDQGCIYVGSANYMHSIPWDFGQFEEDMVKICLRILDLNFKHYINPSDDVASRANPIDVGRRVSAMVNSEDDQGILEGQWSEPYIGGHRPTHWTGSYDILKKWFMSGSKPVKYGQCWVFAGVMCSVMRLLGIPCRVVTNFESAHDTDKNLTIDVYRPGWGLPPYRLPFSPDSVWNFHVWTEGWMKRPDLSKSGKYDGWQVLDPTPQELSGGLYQCGPASVKAILAGETALKYDVPFVFAEVNADCVDWMVKRDGSKVRIWTDHARVGKYISTKSVNSFMRQDITNSYKHKERTRKERAVFEYAITRDYSKVPYEEVEEDYVPDYDSEEEEEEEEEEPEEETESEEDNSGAGGTEDEAPGAIPPPPPVTMRFEEEAELRNGKDVKVKLVLHSESSVPRRLAISIDVTAMRYNGRPAADIKHQETNRTLLPGKDLIIPIRVPFKLYHKPMVESDSMKISALVTDKASNKTYLAEDDIVLLAPRISVKLLSPAKLNQWVKAQVIFVNPTLYETLTDCKLFVSGSGLMKEPLEKELPDLRPFNRLRIEFSFQPSKTGKKVLTVDFDCFTFRDIKATCVVDIKP